MTLLSEHDAAIGRRARPAARLANPPRRARRGAGAVITIVGLAAWAGWLSWRVAHPTMSAVGFAVLLLELVAFAAAIVVSAGLAAARPPRRHDRRSTDRRRPLPLLLAEALDLGEVVNEQACRPVGDDTGEIAWARRGIRVLGEQRPGRSAVPGLPDAAWSVVAVDGLRRVAAIAVLLVVLFTGATPFPTPPLPTAMLLAGGLSCLAVGHWLLSGGHVRPGSRLIWSMSSVGAGLGDGISRSGLPIRWMVTMATIVALNIGVALRGISDRWTHGLGAMDRDARIVAMSLAVVFVAAGGLALTRMARPALGFYGATRRLEEDSVRRLALGLTLIVAAVGFVAGVLPVDAVAAAR